MEAKTGKDVINMFCIQTLWNGQFSPCVDIVFQQAKAALEKQADNTEEQEG